MKFVKDTAGKTLEDEHLILIEYHKTGNLEVLGKLYANYMPLVYGLALKYLKDEDAAKDAVMQIFEQLIEKLRVHEVTNFKSWLYSLARNHCLMMLRSSSKHEFVSFEENIMENDAFVHLDIDETRERQFSVMDKCIEALPEEQRISIRLFYLEQKCYTEVAARTGFTMSKVKSYIQNGKRNLKICISRNSEK